MNESSGRSVASLQVVLMFAIIIATLLLGFFMMPSGQEEQDRLLQKLGTTNHGTLLAPVKPVEELTLTDEQGAPWRPGNRKPRWRLLIPAGRDCDGDCGELLYTTRQAHIRLGKNSHRLERLLLATEGGPSPALQREIESTHPYLKVVHADAEEIVQWLSQTNSPWRPGEGQVIVVDPGGVAMMTWDISHAGNDMLEDLNHLLKYSAD